MHKIKMVKIIFLEALRKKIKIFFDDEAKKTRY